MKYIKKFNSLNEEIDSNVQRMRREHPNKPEHEGDLNYQKHSETLKKVIQDSLKYMKIIKPVINVITDKHITVDCSEGKFDFEIIAEDGFGYHEAITLKIIKDGIEKIKEFSGYFLHSTVLTALMGIGF